MHILVETEQRYNKGKKIVQACFLLIIITYIFSIGFELLSNNTSTAFGQLIMLAFLSGIMYLTYTGIKWSKIILCIFLFFVFALFFVLILLSKLNILRYDLLSIVNLIYLSYGVIGLLLLLSKSVRVFFEENHNLKHGLNSIDNNIARLWTWKGKYFGCKAGQQLWTYDSRHVGIFINEEVYGQDGLYLGEIYKGRLVRNKNKLTQKKEPFIPENINIKMRKFDDISSMMVMFDDYEDFPEV